MKSRKFPGVVVLLFFIAVLVVVFVDPWGSPRKGNRQILLTDRVKIDLVRIAGTLDTVTLSRSGEAWLLPGGELANQVAVENLMFAAKRLQVDAAQSDLSEWAIGVVKEVSFLSKKKLVLQYKTLSRDGRFLLLPTGSVRAFAVSLPGYPDLDLDQVFSDSENHYREHVFIDLLPKEIRLIEVEKRGGPAFRFTRDESGEISCELPLLDSLIPMKLLNEELLRMLFTYFTSIPYEVKTGDLPDSPDVPMEWEMAGAMACQRVC